MELIKVSQSTSFEDIILGKAYILTKKDYQPSTEQIHKEQAEEEKERVSRAIETVSAELEVLGQEDPIFAAHQQIAEDETLRDEIFSHIEDDLQNGELATCSAVDRMVQLFQQMEDTYLRERSADIKDVGRRILLKLKGEDDVLEHTMEESSILVAKELSPSDMPSLDFDRILGIITEEGGVTSHVAIMAGNMGIPYMAGIHGITEKLRGGELLVLDGENKKIVLEPSLEMEEEYKKQREEMLRRKEIYERDLELPAVTRDGKVIHVVANVGSMKEIMVAQQKKVHAVGLFRSEFLYMESGDFPTEEEQFAVYKEAAQTAYEELTIRTLDIGGDKKLPYFTFDAEDNPFLGWRAIRISLDMTSMFKAQLRAILRASAFGKVRIMFPMIISLDELRRAKEVLAECKRELRSEAVDFNEEIPVGIMIETPAAVILADEFAKEVDFFSIGTNDLVQYTLAVDRGNRKIEKLYDYNHPAVLKSIERVIKAAHAEGIMAGMCGEMAADEGVLEKLVKMGLDEFSMSCHKVAKIKYLIRKMSVSGEMD